LTPVLLLAAFAPALAAHAIIRKVPEQYTTIQLALDDAREGDIVLVAPGNYQESLEVHRSVYLISEEPGAAVLDADQDDAIRASHLDGGMLQVIGFAIHNCQAAVVVEESSGAVVDTTVSGCMPVDEMEDLIAFSGEADATVARVELTDNESYDPANIGLIGMYIDGHAVVVDSVIATSNASGMTIDGDAALVRGNTVENTMGDAIIMSADSAIVLENLVNLSDGTGIAVPAAVDVLIRDNEIIEAEFGLEFAMDGSSVDLATVLYNLIDSSEQAGVAVMSDTRILTVGHNEIRNGGSRGLWLQDPDLTAMVHDNVIADNAVLGISIGMAAEGFVETSDVTVRRNLVTGNLSQGIQLQDSDALLINNTLVGNGDYGIYHATSIEEPTFWPTMKNNIVTGHAETGIWTDYGTCDITYSMLWDNTVDLDACAGGEGLLMDDPLFTDPDAGDYTLQAGSPAIDAGDPDAAHDDEDGTPNDLGAYGGPAEADPDEDLAPTLEFAAEEDLREGECRSIRIPDGVDPEGYPLFVEWAISGGSNGTWEAYGPEIRLCGEDDGEFNWTTTVTDPYGQQDTADGTMTIININPGITSVMPDSATVGVDYLYQVELFDPGYFDTFDYVIESGPENMSVDEFGVVSWTPDAGQEGDHVIQLVVTDDDGGESTQIETITVGGGSVGDDDDDDDCSCDHDARADGRAAVALLLVAALALRRRCR